MPIFRTAALAAVFTHAFVLAGSAPPVANDAYERDMDRSIKPGDDFYHYANGGWLKASTIPAGQSAFDNRAFLFARNTQPVTGLMQEAAASSAAKGSLAQKVGDYFASFLDQSAIDAKGLAPLEGELAKISAIKDTPSLSAYLGATLNVEVDGLTANADHVFGLWV